MSTLGFKTSLGKLPTLEEFSVKPPFLIMLDFDGTLIDIVPKPELIRVPTHLPQLLTELKQSGNEVYIVTGRKSHDVKERLTPARIPVIGLHGLDWNGAIEDTRPDSFDEIAREIAELAKKHPGFIVDDKHVILGFHFRQIDSSTREIAKKQVRAILAKHFINSVVSSMLSIIEGHEIIELKPKHKNKATAVRRLSKEHPGLHPIYIGDDVPDEEAILELGARATTLRVAPSHVATHAQFRVNSPTEVIAFLNSLLKL